MDSAREEILLVQLEFHTWEMARSWGYSGNFGIEEGLIANGANVQILPAMHRVPSSSPTSLLSRAEDLFSGCQFDQVWVSLVHSPYESGFLEWLNNVAPVRVGCLYESLEYNSSECVQNPQLITRRKMVLEQIKGLTHLICSDEADAEYLNENRIVPAIWNPTFVPERFLAGNIKDPDRREAIFNGSLYSVERKAWAANPEFDGLLLKPDAPENSTPFPGHFDDLHTRMLPYLQNGGEVNRESLNQYVDDLRVIRKGAFAAWMEGLAGWTAIINLPSFGKVYTSRVAEAMAVGTPVISWDIPDRERNRSLFIPGEEILLFNRDNPAELKLCIEQLQQDKAQAMEIAKQAREKIRKYHTAEVRMRQILEWIAKGKLPEFGESVVEEHSDSYYIDFFTKDPHWSTPFPNNDEQARWDKICVILKQVAVEKGESIRILDVGCGRGWLTNLADQFGQCDGVEPVSGVVEHARHLFPHLNFFSGTPQDLIRSGEFKPYDVIITSEVIEHVPRSEQGKFIQLLKELITPAGFLILTTPRQEVLERLIQVGAQSRQPLEEWLSEEEVENLASENDFTPVVREKVLYDLKDDTYPNHQQTSGPDNSVIALYQVWGFQLQSKLVKTLKSGDTRTTVFILTVGDQTFPTCLEAVENQIHTNFKTEIIRNKCPFNVAASEMFKRCETEFLIQVDEDMVLFPHAVLAMESVMAKMPEDVGMACYNLFDEDREIPIHGVKIYRTSLFKNIEFQDLKASEMDLLEQMAKAGIKWVTPLGVLGRHGTDYSLESIYRRYKNMYEKDISSFNYTTLDIRKKAEKFRKTGDPCQLFALLGAAHGIVNGEHHDNSEMDFRKYDLKALGTFKELLLGDKPFFNIYDKNRQVEIPGNKPVPLSELKWHPCPQPLGHELKSEPGELKFDLSKIVGWLRENRLDEALEGLETILRQNPQSQNLINMYQDIINLKIGCLV